MAINLKACEKLWEKDLEAVETSINELPWNFIWNLEKRFKAKTLLFGLNCDG